MTLKRNNKRLVRMVGAWAVFAAASAAAVTLGGLSPWVVVVLAAAVFAATITTATVLPCLVLRRLPAPLAAYCLGRRHLEQRGPRLRLVHDDTRA